MCNISSLRLSSDQCRDLAHRAGRATNNTERVVLWGTCQKQKRISFGGGQHEEPERERINGHLDMKVQSTVHTKRENPGAALDILRSHPNKWEHFVSVVEY